MKNPLLIFFPMKNKVLLASKAIMILSFRVEDTLFIILVVSVDGITAGYTAAPVACRWVGAVFDVTGAFEQEQ